MSFQRDERAPVTVVLATFNGKSRGFLSQAIESVLAQTLLPAEFIVVDDGSTDGTAEFLATRFPKGIVIVRKANGGLGSARNAGIAASTCPFIAFIDDDDEWVPSKLERQLPLLLDPKNRHVGILFSAVDMVDEMGRSCQIVYPGGYGYSWPAILLRNNVLAPSSVLMRRDVFTRVGLFAEDINGYEDYDLWIKASRAFGIAAQAIPFVKYRMHIGQMTQNRRYFLEGVLNLIEKYCSDVNAMTASRVMAYNYYSTLFTSVMRLDIGFARDILRRVLANRFHPMIFLLCFIGMAIDSVSLVPRRWVRIFFNWFYRISIAPG